MGLANTYCKLWQQGSTYEKLLNLPLKSISDQGKRVKSGRGVRAKRMATSDIKAAVELYRSGKTVYEIQAILGFHRETIARALTSAGVRMRRGHITNADTAEAVRRYAAGESTAKIGRALGYSAQSVQRRLVKEGVTLRRPGRPAR